MFFRENEFEDIVKANINLRNSFFSLPQIDERVIKQSYLGKYNKDFSKELIKCNDEIEFNRKFHWFTEDYGVVDDWLSYKEKHLISLLRDWCDGIGIDYYYK